MTGNTNETMIEITHLKKGFADKEVLRDINLNLHKGENLIILGRSGEGKSVTIQCIVGLLEYDDGSLKVFGQEVRELQAEKLLEVRTKVGFLFQSGALYDSMSVRENLEFPLKRVLNIRDQGELDKRVEEMLAAVGLEESIDKLPGELSGGMRKRIGLARTLILKPAVMLYDEPTTGLDPISSREISELIVRLQKKYETSSIIITHDMSCAKIAGDRLLVLHEGTFVAEGSYEELAASTDNYVHDFFV
jgi:phospholipid/cholesterol/gamma-HCH transport system ATP-binding protein